MIEKRLSLIFWDVLYKTGNCVGRTEETGNQQQLWGDNQKMDTVDNKLLDRFARCCQSCKQFNDYEKGGFFWFMYCWQESWNAPKCNTYCCPQGNCAIMTAEDWRRELNHALRCAYSEHPKKVAQKQFYKLLRILQKCLAEWESHPSYKKWIEKKAV